MPVVVDTHIVIWYFQNPDRLSPLAVETLDQVIQTGDKLMMSAISIIEICYLIERNKIPTVLLERLRAELQRPDSQLVTIPIGQEIALVLPRIDRAIVPEMPDRIIAATAFYLNLPLVTSDLQIRALTMIQVIW